ncbi:uncharacterized protein [Euwallacea similis]|uniref:uncharacterized protein n=1 Tax=Euwallacea similis TaxID=1736056 RepID=UPI00345006C7
MAPVDVLVKRRTETYSKGPQMETEATERRYKEWQERWRNYRGWTTNFVVNVRKWAESGFGNFDYFAMQAMTGHGVFGVYLKKIGKAKQGVCWFCSDRDAVKHTMFEYAVFREHTQMAKEKCEERLTVENIGKIIVRSEGDWSAVTNMLRSIMKKKKEEERRRERGGEQAEGRGRDRGKRREGN